MSTQLKPLPSSPAISVIIPVLNEEGHLFDSVTSILSQEYHGDFEVVLALGPSRDGTDEIAKALVEKDSRVKLVPNPSGKTAAGLNAAIANSHNEIIVRVDGHAELPPDYLATAVEILRTTGAVNVGGIMGAEGISKFEKAVARAMRSALGVGSSRFHTGGEPGVVDTVYLGVFRREALIAAGGFDERFTRAQDWELNFRLRKNGGTIFFDPRLHVTYRPRPNLKKLAHQYFEYGRWRRVVSRSHLGTINYRYAAPPLAVIGTLASLVLGLIVSPLFFIPAGIYALFITGAAVAISQSIFEFFLLLVIMPTMHFSWGLGFLTSPKTLVPTLK